MVNPIVRSGMCECCGGSMVQMARGQMCEDCGGTTVKKGK